MALATLTAGSDFARRAGAKRTTRTSERTASDLADLGAADASRAQPIPWPPRDLNERLVQAARRSRRTGRLRSIRSATGSACGETACAAVARAKWTSSGTRCQRRADARGGACVCAQTRSARTAPQSCPANRPPRRGYARRVHRRCSAVRRRSDDRSTRGRRRGSRGASPSLVGSERTDAPST